MQLEISRSPQGERGLKPVARGAQGGHPGRSPQGERGLKRFYVCRRLRPPCCRSPQGERGLKLEEVGHIAADAGSLPARGAWVETAMLILPAILSSRSPQGERGLKLYVGYSL